MKEMQNIVRWTNVWRPGSRVVHCHKFRILVQSHLFGAKFAAKNTPSRRVPKFRSLPESSLASYSQSPLHQYLNRTQTTWRWFLSVIPESPRGSVSTVVASGLKSQACHHSSYPGHFLPLPCRCRGVDRAQMPTLHTRDGYLQL